MTRAFPASNYGIANNQIFKLFIQINQAIMLMQVIRLCMYVKLINKLINQTCFRLTLFKALSYCIQLCTHVDCIFKWCFLSSSCVSRQSDNCGSITRHVRFTSDHTNFYNPLHWLLLTAEGRQEVISTHYGQCIFSFIGSIIRPLLSINSSMSLINLNNY